MTVLQAVLTFLSDNQLVILLLCLALGYWLGKANLGKFPMNATLGTIFVALAVNLLFRFGVGAVVRYAEGLQAGALTAESAAFCERAAALKAKGLSIPGMLSAFFYALFSFALGYASGPDFFGSLLVRGRGRKDALKQFALCLFYSACALAAALAVLRLFGIRSPGRANGLLAGAQTQSSILSVGDVPAEEGGLQMVAYAVSYVIGTVLMILFVRSFAPALLHKNLHKAVEEHMALRQKEAGGSAAGPDSVIPTHAIQLRAYTLGAADVANWGTVNGLEEAGSHRFEVVCVYRDGRELEKLNQDTALAGGDVIAVAGDAQAIISALDHLEEKTDDRGIQDRLKIQIQSAEIVYVEKEDAASMAEIRRAATEKGVLLQDVLRNGKSLPQSPGTALHSGDTIRVTGLKHAVESFAAECGYLKTAGTDANVPVMLLTIALAAVLGAVIRVFNTPLGTGTFALLLGMVCGFWNHRQPKRAYVPKATLSFVRSLGLNLFIASVTLNASLELGSLFNPEMAKTVLGAALVCLIPLFLSLFFGRYVLKLDTVPLLGGLCGSGTCTAALTALEDGTDSRVFTAGYTPAYVLGNITLTLVSFLTMTLL